MHPTYAAKVNRNGICAGSSRNGRAGFNGRIMPIGFVFRCPNTGLNVQGWVAENPSEPKSEAYEAVTCTACARVHLVEPRTGKILGSAED